MTRSGRTRATFALALVVWGILVAAGLFAVHSFELTPGRPPDRLDAWPSGGRIAADPSRANLVVAIHPRCACTRATLDALAEIMERSRGSVTAHLLFYRPGPGHDRWEPGDLQRRAAGIAGVRLYDDPDGAEAARFGAETSGTVFLYDRARRLRFAGGITPARGRTGANPGLDAVIAHLSGRPAPPAGSPVFGCPIRNVSATRSAL